MRARWSPDVQQELFTPVEAAAPAVSTGVLHKEWKIQSPKNTPCINNTLASTPPHVRKHKVDTWAVTSSPVCCGACWQQDGGPSVRGLGAWGRVGQNWETHAYDITAHLPDVVTPGVSPGMTRPWSGSGCCRANWPAVFIPQHSCTRTDTLQPILPGIMKRLDWLQFTFCKLTVGVPSTGIILVIFQRPPHSCILLSAMQILFFPAWSCLYLYLCLSYRCIVHLPAARCVSTAELLHLFQHPLSFLFHSKITFFSLYLCFKWRLVFPDTNTHCSFSPFGIFASVFPCVFLHISWRLKQTRYGRNVAAQPENVSQLKPDQKNTGQKREEEQLFQEDIQQIFGIPAQKQANPFKTGWLSGCTIDGTVNQCQGCTAGELCLWH